MNTNYNPLETTAEEMAMITQMHRAETVQHHLRKIMQTIMAMAECGSYNAYYNVECDKEMAQLIEEKLLAKGFKVDLTPIGRSFEFGVNWK
jgi:UDP-N-acetylglucosamine 2-epimerase